MERAAQQNLYAPKVFPKRNHRSKKLTSVGLEVNGIHYYLSVSEALNLANRLVDNAERVQAAQKADDAV